MSESSFEQEVWDKKKISLGITALIVIVTVAIGAKIVLSHYGIGLPQTAVEGIQTQNPNMSSNAVQKTFSLPSTQDVNQKIQTIQQQVTHLNLAEMASASPQMRQIIQQIQALPQLPAQQAKQACIQLCDKL